jgi:vancomycin aglycone glucosyltransferase
VAELHGVPYRYVMYCPALIPSAEHAPVGTAQYTPPRWVNRLAWRAMLAFYESLIGAWLNHERAALGLPRVRGVYAHLVGRSPLLAADRALAPAPADAPIAEEQTRCWHPLAGERLPDKLEDFLGQGPPPVCFGFGSMTDPDPARTTRAILDAVERCGCRALVSAGWAELGDVALPGDVMRIGSVSHARLFPRLAAVVHHGGAGTTTTAARAGVPQVVVPHVLDQFYWAERVARLGIGVHGPRRSRLDADSLAAALAQVLDNEIIAERARELGERLRREALAAADPVERLLSTLSPA